MLSESGWTEGKMRIQFCLLASGVLLGAMVPVIILYSGISYTKYPKEFTSAQTFHIYSQSDHTAEDDFRATSQRSEQWSTHIKKSCKKFGYGRNEHNFHPDMLKRTKILVDDRNKMLYCQIPKVASTTWRRIFIVLSGEVQNTDPMSLSANDVHHKYDRHLIYLHRLEHKEIVHRLNTYFKFVFVREPFERLLSAFRNKFVAQTNSSLYFKNVFGRKIINKYRLDSNGPNKGDNVTFEEFVRYLTDPNKSVPMNEHWERFYKLCHPCWITYDFIGKLETLEEDSKYILERNSLSGKIKVPSRLDSKYSTHKTQSYMSEYYSKIPRNSIHSLLQMFYADFVIFNFTIPDIIKALM